MKRRAPSQKLTRFNLTHDEELLALLKELTPVAADATVSSLVGWRDTRGNLRRARGVYDNGWSIDLFLTLPKDGKVSLSSYRINWRGEIRGKAA